MSAGRSDVSFFVYCLWIIYVFMNAYKAGDKHCDLCLSEKVIIIKNINNPKTINKKTDVGTTCVHRRSSYLSGIT